MRGAVTDKSIELLGAVWVELLESCSRQLRGEALWATFSRDELTRIRAVAVEVMMREHPPLTEHCQLWIDTVDRLLAAKDAS